MYIGAAQLSVSTVSPSETKGTVPRGFICAGPIISTTDCVLHSCVTAACGCSWLVAAYFEEVAVQKAWRKGHGDKLIAGELHLFYGPKDSDGTGPDAVE